MARIERVREALQSLVDPDLLRRRVQAGWRPVAIEWERTIEGEETEAEKRLEQVPFGLQVATDCSHLEENPREMQALKYLSELIVLDLSLPQMAEELNRRGYRTREGKTWGPIAVFEILTRVIEIAPKIFSSEEWVERRRQLSQVAWNS